MTDPVTAPVTVVRGRVTATTAGFRAAPVLRYSV